MECDRNVDTWDCMWQRVIQGISSIETYVFMDHVVFFSPNDVFVSMLSISLQGLESRQVDICSYLGQPVFNGDYGLAISWIQCPKGNVFLI